MKVRADLKLYLLSTFPRLWKPENASSHSLRLNPEQIGLISSVTRIMQNISIGSEKWSLFDVLTLINNSLLLLIFPCWKAVKILRMLCSLNFWLSQEVRIFRLQTFCWVRKSGFLFYTLLVKSGSLDFFTLSFWLSQDFSSTNLWLGPEVWILVLYTFGWVRKSGFVLGIFFLKTLC